MKEKKNTKIWEKEIKEERALDMVSNSAFDKQFDYHYYDYYYYKCICVTAGFLLLFYGCEKKMKTNFVWIVSNIHCLSAIRIVFRVWIAHVFEALDLWILECEPSNW